jgi:hypothetical protein
VQVFTVTALEGQKEAVQAFVRRMSPGAQCTYAIAGTFKYALPQSDLTLSAVFDAMAAAPQAGLEVQDWGVHSATLEDVFIRLAQQPAPASTLPWSPPRSP